MNKQLLASLNLVPKFSHMEIQDVEFQDEDDIDDSVCVIKVLKAIYETDLVIVEKNINPLCNEDEVTFITVNKKRATFHRYNSVLLDVVKKINNILLKNCSDFDKQIELNKRKYFFDFVLNQ
jgi:hypothetical protein